MRREYDVGVDGRWSEEYLLVSGRSWGIGRADALEEVWLTLMPQVMMNTTTRMKS